MKFAIATVLSLVCVLFIVNQVQCARILAIIPTPSYSHQLPFRRLLLDLSNHGHEVVFVTPDIITNLNHSANFKQIDIKECYKVVKHIKFMRSRFNYESWMEVLHNDLWDTGVDIIDKMLTLPEIKALYAPGSSEKFDVVMAEVIFLPSIYAFAYRFNAPLIGIRRHPIRSK